MLILTKKLGSRASALWKTEMFEHQSQDFQIKCRQKNTTFRPEYTVENLPVGFLGPPALLRRYDFRGHVSCILVKGNSPFSYISHTYN